MQTTSTARGPWTARKLVGLIAATLAVATLLLTNQAKPAHAAPPTLTASENPVTIMYGSNTKGISVSWNLNGLAMANLSVVEVGGPFVLSQQVLTQKGSAPFTVTYGKSYKASLLDVFTGATLVQVDITTRRPPNWDLDLGDCLFMPCITSVTFQPHGTWAEFTVKTTKAAKFQMAICGTAFTSSGGCANPVSGIFNLSYVTEWDSHVMGLAPNTTYYYRARAEDQQGNVVTKTGTLKTLRRRVEVTFADIKVTDDSDDLSPCDCTFWFQVQNQAAKSYGEVQVSTGNWVHPNIKFTVDNAPDTLTLRVEGQDDDDDWGGSLCTNGTAPSWSVGSNDCMSWTGGSFTINVAASGFGEEFTGSFGGPWLNYSGELNFDLYGSYTVSYVP